MKKNILFAIALGTFSYSFANEPLPLQKVDPVKKESIVEKDQFKNENSKIETLTDIEQANIKDIYNRKIQYPQFEMGIRYYTGSNGLTQDYDKAIYWFSNSSRDEENPKADMMIAAMYYQGQGFKQDKIKAISFYQRAANRGSLEAQLILTGIHFFNQQLMNQEYANYWIYKAIEQDSPIAETLRSLILLNANDEKTISKLMPTYENLANKKDPIASFMIGYFYFTGKFKEQSFEKAEPYLAVSAESGNPIAIVMIEEILNFSELENSNKHNDSVQ